MNLPSLIDAGEEIFNEKDTKWDAKHCQEGTYIYFIRIRNLKNREFYYRGKSTFD